MMASARASAAEREAVYAKLQLSMETLQLDLLQAELDREAAADGERDAWDKEAASDMNLLSGGEGDDENEMGGHLGNMDGGGGDGGGAALVDGGGVERTKAPRRRKAAGSAKQKAAAAAAAAAVGTADASAAAHSSNQAAAGPFQYPRHGVQHPDQRHSLTEGEDGAGAAAGGGSMPGYGGIPVATVLEGLQEAQAISSAYAGPAPKQPAFTGHRCVHAYCCCCCCYCLGASLLACERTVALSRKVPACMLTHATSLAALALALAALSGTYTSVAQQHPPPAVAVGAAAAAALSRTAAMARRPRWPR
jgi:hypothetical protein